MKAKSKHPVLWAVIWNDDGDVVHVSLKKPSRKWKDSNGEKVSVLRYHLHPGNEVKLKCENAMMRRWLKVLHKCDATTYFNNERKTTWIEAERKMPGLFAGGGKGSK